MVRGLGRIAKCTREKRDTMTPYIELGRGPSAPRFVVVVKSSAFGILPFPGAVTFDSDFFSIFIFFVILSFKLNSRKNGGGACEGWGEIQCLGDIFVTMYVLHHVLHDVCTVCQLHEVLPKRKLIVT